MSDVTYGYTLSSEEMPPKELVRQARRAEEAGFEFCSISDHFHPWVEAQGHSPFVWSVLGGIAATTDRIRVGVGVTCPIVRLHPAIAAHAAATTSLMFDDRFFLGVGTGEALNEHILGHRWPPPEVRRDMLREAMAIMRELWTGETVDHHGDFYTVENARLFDPPRGEIPVVVSGFGSAAAAMAAELGDGYWGTSPSAEPVDRYREAGGDGPRYGQISVCWAEEEDEAAKTVSTWWPNAGVSGQLSQDLPTWTHFEAAVEPLTEEQIVGSIPCGPDVDRIVDSVREYVDAGYDHLYFHQIGPDQDGFLRLWDEKLRAALAS